MKKHLLSLFGLIISISVLAQVPQGISHQAVIRNAANELVTNLPVGIKVSILQGVPDGTEVYSENHTPQSNANGLITFVIGQGANQTTDFSAINWADGPYFVKTEADPEGGTNYTIEGVSQLWSVPYALSAGAGIAAGDSLVLKDEQGMTRFVLNPNTGTFKMMNNDTTWYSLEVKSPAKQTGIDYYGRYYEKNPVSGTTTFYSDASKEKILEERTDNIGIGLGLISEVTKYYDNGNEKYYEKHEQIEPDPNPVFKSEYITYNEDGIIKKWVVYETDASGKVLKEMVYYENKKQSETTHSSSIFPGMGFRIVTDTEETFQGEEETLIKKKIETRASKHSPEEKYEQTVTSNQFYENGVISREVIESLVDKWNETVKIQERIAKMFDQVGNQVSEIKIKNTSDANYDHESGSMSRSNTTEMFVNGVKVADQNRSMEHHPDPSNYTTDTKSSGTYLPDGSLISKTESEKATWPGGTMEKNTRTYVDEFNSTIEFVNQFLNGMPESKNIAIDGINRENTEFINNDVFNQEVTTFNDADNNTTAKVTEKFNKNDALYKRTVEKPGEGSTTFSQGKDEIEFDVSKVVTNGCHHVTGLFVGLGGAFFSGFLSVEGNLYVEGTKNFRINHPSSPGKYLVHAAIESNEVLNQYSGNVITNADGFATITLPGYFNLINNDFRYQLTIVGATFARAIIFSEIDENNQFIIKTDEPNTKVSWQVTAKRNDQYLIDNPFLDVVDK